MCLFTGVLHHALLAIFPDNNFTGILHHEMHAIFPGKHDDYTKSTKDWVILWYSWRQREREAVATDFLRRPYATPEWRWIWRANKIYGITAFMLNGLYRNMPVFLEDNFLILEHKVSFGFVPYPSSVLIYKNLPRGKRPITARLSCQWSVA